MTDYHGYATFQEFLDNVQYSRIGILSYEKIFGHTYVSTGGEDTTNDLCSALSLRPDSSVLDIGCGIGGSAFYLARKYGCRVEAIDLSKNMLDIGMERLKEQVEKEGLREDQVRLVLADCTTVDYPEASFDLVYSRDTILHIADKATLYQRCLRWLKPGGQLLVTDYCCGEKPWPDDYAAYVKQRGYHLLTVPEYGAVLSSVGFTDVEAIDFTDRFRRALVDEQSRVVGLREQFLKDVGEQMYQYILDGWGAKIGRVDRGCQRWGLFKARKPL
ncbi:hypothetical protein BOX15_Mlig015119g9 [Macrostomum lignano]|uniref:phosphoethanolamine N-methyltransferase n=2 Tax=Macrostomum lignano TaxID=282301 RepID=A0A1I8HYC6_9PLAT|nr:hypothetical protein BOX15_Mlig015119g4 [Macrostomum lignano]PAA78210.1 hypothetical protein BOX15_Mlig015119g9 [Macrostomum lignano]